MRDRLVAVNLICSTRRAARNRWRFLWAAVYAACCVALTAAQPVFAATLFAQLFPKTGEIRLQNRDSLLPMPIVFYSISSANRALNGSPSVWKSITRTYDAPFGLTPGNGFVDPNGEWIEISSAATQLAEGALDADGGMIPSQRSISLGRIWNPNVTSSPDLVFAATALNGQPIDVSAVYALDGDYLPDGVVNAFDYQLWRQFYGSTSVLLADGNLNGVVDAADYTVWRNNLGMSVPSLAISALSPTAQPGLSASTAIPEPASGMLLLSALTGLFILKKHCVRLSRRVEDPPWRERQRAIEQ